MLTNEEYDALKIIITEDTIKIERSIKSKMLFALLLNKYIEIKKTPPYKAATGIKYGNVYAITYDGLSAIEEYERG